ncbi:MAG: carbonate dehydratase [Proteobacteria bacterium]|nr:carbonate dehydratase [Pseudomonadota bacterium]
MSDLDHLIKQNSEWAANVKQQDPDFFNRLSKQQKPKILWIGCSDSRVPANQIIGLPPGEVFVHRNIANVVAHSDLNCLSVVHYAVEVLAVEHIIVCGHYGCGGVAAAMDDAQYGLIDNWLHHIKDISRIYAETLANTPKEKRADVLCELNVREQLKNVAESSVVKKAWEQGKELTLHGWIYSIKDGLIRKLERIEK